MEDALSSPVLVDDVTASAALRDFLGAVLESDGPGEVRRLAQAFGCQIQAVQERDWSDGSGDGALKIDAPGALAMSARNGQ